MRNNLLAALAAALAAGGAPAFNAAFQPSDHWRGATPARHRAKKTRYAVALERHWAKKRREAMPKVGGHPRDAHGAVTFVGPAYECVGVEPTSREFVLSGGKEASGERFYTARRIWLGGISAQRGF